MFVYIQQNRLLQFDDFFFVCALDVLRIVIKKSNVLYLILEAVTEIVPDFIWAPDFFGP